MRTGYTSPESESPRRYAALRQGKRVDLQASVPLAGPLTIYIEPTNICNFRCICCPESFADYEVKSGGLSVMTPEDFAYVADELESFNTIQTLNFYMMGEPFANKYLSDFIANAKRRALGRQTIVTSNGSLLKPECYAALCASGLDYLRISIYGSNEKLHRQNTGSPIKLARIRDNVAGLKAYRDTHSHAGPHIYVKMVESENPAINEEFLRAFADVGDEVLIEPIMNWNDPDEGNLAQIDRDVLQRREYFAHKKDVCPFPFYTLVIHSDLKVSACCVDWNKKTVIGDLRTETLKQIWTGEALHALQLRHLEKLRIELPGCSNCTYLHTAPDNLDCLDAATYAKRLGAFQL